MCQRCSLRPYCWLMFVLLLVGCAEKIDTSAEFLEVAHKNERDGKLPEAVAAYGKALELDKQNPTAWYDLGVAYSAMDQFPESIEAYSRAIELDSGMAQAFNNRAAAYARLQQFEQAIADCDRAVILNPEDYLAWRNRGLARHDHGELDGALSDYDESIRIQGRSAETYHYRGNVFLDRKQWSRALEDFEQAIHLDEQMSPAWLSRAITLARLGRAEDSEASRAKAKALGSNVDDVIVADLLPVETVPEETAPRTAESSHQQAVGFVRTRFTDEQTVLEPADAPWDLATSKGETKRRFIVRMVDASLDDAAITFSAQELEKIQNDEVDTTLVVVQVDISLEETPDVGNESDKEQEPATQNDPMPLQKDASGFTVVRTIENWTPDLSQMQPVVWSLPLAANAETARTDPVVSVKNSD